MQNLRLFIVTLFCLLNAIPAFSNDNELRWGSDADSGAPYVFRDSNNPSSIIGVDVDIVTAIATHLNMKPIFVQNQWDGLIPGLQASNYDMVINGLEIIEERKQSIRFSIPYYITHEQIVVNRKNHDINALADLKGKKVGTLPASLAYMILKDLANKLENILLSV